MPELPDVTVYVERLQALLGGSVLRDVRLASPFVLRTAEPPLASVKGMVLDQVTRLGKRIVFRMRPAEGKMEDAEPLFLVVHLMIAGRLRLREPGAKITGGIGLLAFDFDAGTLILTEASKKRRASLHVVRGDQALREMDRGGLEVMQADVEAFGAALTRENHTLKRAMTDPRVLSGIGNAYSDEILHRARLSPFKQTRALSPEETQRLFQATRAVLTEWTDRLREEAGPGLPEKVTAFREGMAVHGRYRQPCPVCGKPVQRIVYAENEANYCAVCQTAGNLLADRSLSRLLKDNWPKTLDELEAARGVGVPAARRSSRPKR